MRTLVASNGIIKMNITQPSLTKIPTYTVEFAKTQYFSTPGTPIYDLIARAESTFTEFSANPANWLSQTGKRFDEKSMASIWRMVECQKQILQNKFEFKAVK